MVNGLPKVVPSYGVCEGCALGKHHQDAFEIGKYWREKTQLELMYNDLCAMNQTSLVGARYALTFINLFSFKIEKRCLEKIPINIYFH